MALFIYVTSTSQNSREYGEPMFFLVNSGKTFRNQPQEGGRIKPMVIILGNTLTALTKS